ncbi:MULTISPECIES: histidine kinase N-terminal 7TM domain-containing protein [unclassified Leptospira]|uniref:LIC10906 family membrane protein n=1 Tax=unclassified Leptospira TaxID=2633828 RepID=UPI0002928E02|nr:MULTISPECIES: histidine kinase N-terminal 7TM domain-containing protein [unclassified Leptospira]EKO76850.1 putative membrane protein [Leptospira sp. Fiocruz LV3954]EMI62687.1 putative membrane protein [Leptospira sp. Fiocruz LV4135]
MIEAGTGLFVISLGFYVWIFASNKPVRNSFFLLTISLSVWLLCLGLRVYAPNEYRSILVNWTLMPVIFTPYFLHSLISYLFAPYKKSNEMSWKSIGNIVVLVYLMISILNCKVVHLTEPDIFAYTPTWIYHLLIGYCSFYILISSVQVLVLIFQKRGDDRVKAFLFFFGIIISLFVSLIFAYIFPLYGYFLASNSAFGVMISSLLWAVAILHYDAFEIREHIIDGDSRPLFLNWIFSVPILKLFQILDPEEYCDRIVLSKTNVILNVTTVFDELKNREEAQRLSTKERAELLARIFNRRIR